jgi:hypothetical protein
MIGTMVKFLYQGMKKQGSVVAVIPAGVNVESYRAPITERMYKGGTVDHESYVLKVGGKYYWPKRDEWQ